jgi:hypothetical protein
MNTTCPCHLTMIRMVVSLLKRFIFCCLFVCLSVCFAFVIDYRNVQDIHSWLVLSGPFRYPFFCYFCLPFAFLFCFLLYFYFALFTTEILLFLNVDDALYVFSLSLLSDSRTKFYISLRNFYLFFNFDH